MHPSAPNTPPNFHPTYRPDIDGMRALAILAVVIYHAFPGKLSGGFIGVDVFFVISGYLISSVIYKSLEKGAFSFTDFYARRVRRLFPALILVLACCYAFGAFALLNDEFAQLAKHTAFSAVFLQNFALWGEAGYFDIASNLKPLMHLWSLAIEEQFYLLFPLLIWGAWRLGLNLFSVVLAGALISFGMNMLTIQDDPAGAFFMPHTRFWELLAGALLAYLQSFWRRQPGSGLGAGLKSLLLPPLRTGGSVSVTARPLRDNLFSVLGLALLLACTVKLDAATQAFPGWRALLPVGAAVLIIMAGPHAWLNRHLLGSKPMLFIGAISYPLYLWHWPLLAFSRIVDEMPPSQRNMAVLLSFVLAWLTYRLVERPIRFGPKRRYTTALLCGLLAAIAYLGWQPTELGRAGVLKADYRNSINRFEYAYKQDCAAIAGSVTGDDWCNAGNAGQSAPNTLLVGDSFSNADAEILAAYARQAPDAGLLFKQAGRGGCPVLIGYGDAACQAFTASVQRYIERTPDIDTIILAGHWPAYVDRQEAGRTTTADQFFQALESTIAYYQRLNKRVIVMLSTPTGSRPRSCLERPISMSKKRLCDLPQPFAMENDGAYRARMLPLLAAKGVAVFDPMPALCDGQICKTIDGDRILYVDINHLSLYGGQYVAQKQAATLDALLRKK